MIRPAQLYRDEISRKMIDTWYDEKYMYYYDTSGKYENTIPDNCNYQRHFASIDKNGNLIGYIGYSFDDYSGYAKWFGILSFTDEPNPEFGLDVLRVFDDIFYKFSMNRIEFSVFADNPVIKSYRAFIKRYGGKEVCTLRETNRLMDGRMHDSVIFEILYQDLVWLDSEGISKMHYDREHFDNMVSD